MRRLLGSLLILALPALAGPNDPVIDCPAVAPAPRVDGNPQDPAWRGVPAHTMSGVDHVHPRFRQNWTGDDDLSATLRAARCGEDLYLLFEVRDEYTVHEASRSWWAGDSIELFLRTDLSGDDPDDRYSNDDYQIFLMPFYAPQRWGVCKRGPEVPYSHGGLRGLEVAHTVVKGGYILEAKIPLWQFHVRPDADGLIGFDVALNDVDDPAATEQQGYLTLSGRFDLVALPRNFARLRIGPWPPPSPTPLPLKAHIADWIGVALGLLAVVVLALLARRTVRTISKRTRVGAASAAAGFLLAAGLCALAPALAEAIDARAVKKTWAGQVEEATTIARTCLDLDRSPEADTRAEHLVALLRDGQVAIRPAYEYRCVPTRDEALRGPPSTDAPGPTHFGVSVPAGERRAFPLPGILAPARIRLDLSLPLVDERAPPGSPAADASLDLMSGASLAAKTELTPHPHLFFDLSEMKGAPLRVLVVRNSLSQPLLVDALYGEDERGAWSALPLAHVAQAGVPLDVWQDRPASHILPVPSGGTATVALPDGFSGNRIWLALRAPGADPTMAGSTDAASFRVRYSDGQPGPEVHLGGRDLAGADPDAVGPMDIALRWEDASRQPLVYTLHAADLDPSRTVAALDVRDLGTLPSLSVVAVTLGRQVSATPPPESGLRLEGTRLLLREEERARLRPLGFSVRSPRGVTRTTGSAGEVPVPIDLAFGQDETGALDVLLPGTPWLQAIARRDAAFAGGAALLLAFAAVIAGASILGKARRLRVKMLVALTAASVVPLVFLVVSLTRLLDVAAEDELKNATLGALTSATDRIASAKAKARDLAFNAARDLLSPAYAADPEAFERRALFNREKVEAQGAFLRFPELDAHRPTRLERAAFFDTLSGPGLYWTPWDGLVAVGFARTADQRRCVVGLPAARLIADAPAGTTVVLSSPAGDALASTGPVPDQLLGPAGRERGHELFDEALRLGHPVYEPLAAAGGEPVAAAHALVFEGSTPLALLGVYRPRAPTDEVKASTLRTLLVSTLAALLLVAIAGGTLVDRVTQRLQRVTRAARAIAAGDLGTRAPVEEEDEVGRLALSFNTMADALDDRVRQLTELQRGLHELTAALDRTEVARAACSLLARATGATSVQVAVLDATGEGLEPLHQRGDGDAIPLATRVPSDGPARDAVELKRSVVREGAAWVPLVAAGRAVGLAVCAPIDRDRDVDRTSLDASGRQIGIALENARLYQAAVTDELTGLYTMPFFVRRLKEEVDRAAAAGRPLSLLRIVIVDLRGLARRHGAAAAARVVAETAAALEGVLPRRNMLGRGPAGELLALLVESDARAAKTLRDRAAAALRTRPFDIPEAPEFGFRTASYPEDGAAADMLLDALFEVTETIEELSDEPMPALRMPTGAAMVASRSPTMRAALDVIARVAPTNATVLLSGETGTGKEVLADLIQTNSGRADAPYVKVNCAAIPDTLVESELFGYERGAFTGAERRHTGQFEKAHKGTLFLDEVGELPLSTQAKLLRVLQERKIARVGGSEEVDIDVRILAASNKDLTDAVRAGAFREDLYHRLHVVELRVPPLRERREDIPHLIDHFRQLFNRLHGLSVESFAPDALDALYHYPWPGNVRELRNVVERTMLMRAGATVELAQLALPAGASSAPPAPPPIQGLTPRQERILKLAKDRGGVTNGDIVKEESVSARTALREAQRLVDRGLLVRVGRRRGAIYRPAVK